MSAVNSGHLIIAAQRAVEPAWIPEIRNLADRAVATLRNELQAEHDRLKLAMPRSWCIHTHSPAGMLMEMVPLFLIAVMA